MFKEREDCKIYRYRYFESCSRQRERTFISSQKQIIIDTETLYLKYQGLIVSGTKSVHIRKKTQRSKQRGGLYTQKQATNHVISIKTVI